MLWYNLAQLLPPVYRAISAMKESADITNESLLEAVSIMERIQRNFFIQTCDETTLADWENRLQIELNELDTLAYRRKRVMAYLNNTTPYTETYWVEVLNMLIGEGEWTLTVQNNEIMLAVTDQTPEYRIKQMMNWASRVKPAHVAFLAGWRYTTEPINHIASSVLCGLSNSVLCKLPKVYVNLYSISNWGTFTQKAVFDPDDNKYIVNGVSYTLSGLITLGEVPNDGTITVYAVASEDESSAYKYTDRSDNVAKYFVQDGTHDFLSETELVESGWQLTQPAFGMIVGGTLAVTSEGETTVFRETMFGTLSRSIGMVATNVTTGTLDKYTPPEPEGIRIGEDTTVPEGTTELFSNYYWTTGFENISSGNNLYIPSNFSYENSALPGDSGFVSVPGTEFDDVVIVGNDTTIEKIVVTNSELQFRLTTYNGKPEIYLNGSFESSAFGNGPNSGVAVNPASTCTSIAKMRYSLGNGVESTGLYKISGTTITWNTEHPLYRLLQGKFAYTTQEG